MAIKYASENSPATDSWLHKIRWVNRRASTIEHGTVTAVEPIHYYPKLI